jgi:site-specific DNA-methyltransferase (adenine-specific)
LASGSVHWIYPAFRHVHRLLKPDSLCVSLYGWHKADEFMAARRRAGSRPVGHIVFRKKYASSTRFMSATHEQAYLLAKGDPAMPEQPIPDVLGFTVTLASIPLSLLCTAPRK